MPLSGPFGFVLIPADESQPIKLETADKAGGLTDDALVKHAKTYFHELTGSKVRAKQLEQASAAERKAIAAQIRQQMSSSSSSSGSGVAERLREMDDDTVINMIYKSQVQPSCDIIALTIPTATNQYTACSLYAADSAKQHGLPANPRATALLTACGHHAANDGGVYGDVFVGRAKDNEATDVWERIDFTVADADPAAEWCRIARSAGGGGGSGNKAAASSLSSLMMQQQQQQMAGNTTSSSTTAVQQQQQPMQIIDGSSSAGGDGHTNAYGMNGAPPVQEAWGSWTQTDDEVEIKFQVAAGTKAKYCKVQFGRQSLKVTVAGQTLLQGTTFDPIATDESSTYTLQDTTGEKRELCVTLSKTEVGRTWVYVVR